MNPHFEYGFVGAACLVLIFSLIAVVAAPTGASSESTLSFDPPVPDEYAFDVPDAAGTAIVDGESFTSLQAAVDAADSGGTVVASGRFSESIQVNTSDLTIESGPDGVAIVDGTGAGVPVTVNAPNVTLAGVWVRNSGYDASSNHAGIWINGTGTRVVDSRVTDVTFGVWVDGVDDVVIENNTIVGREAVRPLSYRGNGIQLWRTDGTRVHGNRITDVRDGIYYSWASNVVATENTMWDLRYGVHYMYSDDCRLERNVAFGNDVGYALMVSDRLHIVDNVAFDNAGSSGHGILLKEIDHSVLRGNHLVGNGNGLFVYNSVNDTLAGNLVLENDVGVHFLAGSEVAVSNNSVIRNGQPVKAVTTSQHAWNGSTRGNYWSAARRIDADGDGVSDLRYKPAGLAEHFVAQRPAAAVFAESPAFDAIRVAERSFPVIEAPGVVDHHPLVDAPHDNWRRYYA